MSGSNCRSSDIKRPELFYVPHYPAEDRRKGGERDDGVQLFEEGTGTKG